MLQRGVLEEGMRLGGRKAAPSSKRDMTIRLVAGQLVDFQPPASLYFFSHFRNHRSLVSPDPILREYHLFVLTELSQSKLTLNLSSLSCPPPLLGLLPATTCTSTMRRLTRDISSVSYLLSVYLLSPQRARSFMKPKDKR